MSNSLILTSETFQPTSWATGIDQCVISQDRQLIDAKNWSLIWVLVGVNDWQQIIEQASNCAPVVALTNQLDFNEMQMALSAGARGYLESASTPETLKLAANSIAMGALWIPENILGKVISTLSSALPANNRSELLEKLTPREQEVALAAAKGMTNKEIARELSITERTVKEHLSGTFSKLEVRDRMQLMIALNG